MYVWMCEDRGFSVKRSLFTPLLLVALSMSSAWSQESNPAPHTHAENEASPQQDASMAGMNMHMEEPSGPQLPSPHSGSGTAWQPASVPAYEWMWMRGGW